MSDLNGKVCVVTGATNGIGKVAALELARRGARVVVVGRNPERAEATTIELRSASGNPSVEAAHCDFAEPEEIRELGAELLRRLDRLDVLVNNAGAINDTRQTNSLGWEVTFAANHMGYFILTMQLLELLKKSAPARIVNVASDAHKAAKIRFDDVHLVTGWSQWGAYGQSKLANILFTRELARRLAGTGVTANSLHPGVVNTGFGMNNDGLVWKFWGMINGLFARTPERGASTIIHLAVDKSVEGLTGRYFADLKERRPAKAAEDDDSARKLWELSELLAAPYLPNRAATAQAPAPRATP